MRAAPNMPATNPTPILTPVSNPSADSGVDEELAIIEEDGITDAVDCNVPVGDGWTEGDELLERDANDPVDAV